jgi:hypothetical protein
MKEIYKKNGRLKTVENNGNHWFMRNYRHIVVQKAQNGLELWVLVGAFSTNSSNSSRSISRLVYIYII